MVLTLGGICSKVPLGPQTHLCLGSLVGLEAAGHHGHGQLQAKVPCLLGLHGMRPQLTMASDTDDQDMPVLCSESLAK